jgi:plastocyanin
MQTMIDAGLPRPARLAVVLCAALFTARCGGGAKPAEKAAVPEAAKPVEYFHVDPATAGTLRGKIAFRGAKPARQAISMDAEAGCETLHAGHAVYDESVVVGKGGGLANAFVYIRTGLEGKNFEPVKETATLSQRGCLFVPRVVGVRAGQTLAVKNADPVSHNIHPMPKNNREWNEQQSPESPVAEHRFGRPEIMIPVKCNVHSWMHAFIGVVAHPYFAVTGPNGSFEWSNVPPGDYTVDVWHESLGVQTKQAHVAASGHAAVDFTYQ